MKQFMKAFVHDSPCFTYIGIKISGVGLEKLKAEILDSPQIRQLISDPNFVDSAFDRAKRVHDICSYGHKLSGQSRS